MASSFLRERSLSSRQLSVQLSSLSRPCFNRTRPRSQGQPAQTFSPIKLGKKGRDARVDGDDLAREYETQPDDGQEAEGVETEKEEGRFRKKGHWQEGLSV
jgi:hypothetical protein